MCGLPHLSVENCCKQRVSLLLQAEQMLWANACMGLIPAEHGHHCHAAGLMSRACECAASLLCTSFMAAVYNP